MHPAGRGQGLSPAVSTPIGFHGSSLICRICHWRAGLLLGGFKPCCHGSQDPTTPPWILCPLTSPSLLLYPAGSLSSLSLYRDLGCLPPLSCTFVSTVCLHVSARPEKIWALPGLQAVMCQGGVFLGGGGGSFCLFAQMHAAISELVSLIKGADDVEQIYGPCLVGPLCSGTHQLC